MQVGPDTWIHFSGNRNLLIADTTITLREERNFIANLLLHEKKKRKKGKKKTRFAIFFNDTSLYIYMVVHIVNFIEFARNGKQDKTHPSSVLNTR